MRRAIGYLRVSTGEQVESGLGIEAQRAAIEREAARLGLTVVAWHEDGGVSGGAPLDRRPGLAAALEELRPGSVLIAAKLDRLARDVLLAGWIELEVARKGAELVSAAGEGTGAGDDPTGLLMRRIVSSFAEFERATIRARTRAALEAKRRRGERVSRHAPVGQRHQDGRLVRDEREARAIELAKALALRGLSRRRIAEELASRGYLGRSGRPFSHVTIGRMVAKRPAAARVAA